MPVVDMRKSQCGQLTSGQMATGQIPTGQNPSGQLQNGHLASGHPTVSGLPPKSPVYALVNKLAKKKSPTKSNNTSPKKQQGNVYQVGHG